MLWEAKLSPLIEQWNLHSLIQQYQQQHHQATIKQAFTSVLYTIEMESQTKLMAALSEFLHGNQPKSSMQQSQQSQKQSHVHKPNAIVPINQYLGTGNIDKYILVSMDRINQAYKAGRKVCT